jgi:hypothetical protein
VCLTKLANRSAAGAMARPLIQAKPTARLACALVSGIYDKRCETWRFGSYR